MKRHCCNVAALCLLLLALYGCSADGKTGLPSALPPDYGAPETESSSPSYGYGENSNPPVDEEDAHGEPEEPGPEAAENGGPRLAINELRTETSRNRVEFIEFRALSAGNLDGLRVFARRSSSAAVLEFTFPPTEVNAGEYVVLHLRTLENQDVSDTSSARHNFWVPGASAWINRTGAVYVLDRDGRALCAVMFSERPDPEWNSRLAQVAEFLFEQGVWKSPEGGVASPEDSVDTSAIRDRNITPSISRDEAAPNTGTAADWYSSALGTPGQPNNPGRL